MIPTPIRQVLSTFQTNGVQALLMGGQACVFYGAAQVSKDVDFMLLAEAGNFARLRLALNTLAARRIAVPPFDPALQARGHAVHFRCASPGVEELRVDVMTRLRDMPEFGGLWERRTVFAEPGGTVFNLLCVSANAFSSGWAQLMSCSQLSTNRRSAERRHRFIHPATPKHF